MLKLWICGADGQLGRALNAELDPLKYEVFNTNATDIDVTDVEQIIRFGDMNQPDIIINCTGFTDFDACEADPVSAFRVNAIGARNLSIVAARTNARLVQLSTDDVFSGEDAHAYTEFDEPDPRTVYGKSKLAGERFVKEFTARHFIVRSTWVYGDGSNFVNNVLARLDASGDEPIAVSSDQYGSPTSAKELARFILTLMNTSEFGTYHVTCKGECSRYQFAKTIMEYSGKAGQIKAVPTAEAELAQRHPTHVVLNNFLLDIMGNYDMPDWKTALMDYLKSTR